MLYFWWGCRRNLKLSWFGLSGKHPTECGGTIFPERLKITLVVMVFFNWCGAKQHIFSKTRPFENKCTYGKIPVVWAKCVPLGPAHGQPIVWSVIGAWFRKSSAEEKCVATNSKTRRNWIILKKNTKMTTTTTADIQKTISSQSIQPFLRCLWEP